MRYFLSITLILPILLTACFGSDTEEPKIVEIETDAALTSDAPEAVLLETARRLYGNGLYSVARSSFESLQATYPLGPYAEYAQLKAADCFFMAREYESAASAYQAFLKDHPTSDSRDYVTFKTGLSHHLSSKGVGLDVNPLELGISFFRDTIRQFPSSPYSVSASYYMEEAEDMIAEHKKEVLEFYQKVGMQTAYEHRLEEFNKQYALHLESDNYAIPLQTEVAKNSSPIGSPQIVKTARVNSTNTTTRASLKLPEISNTDSLPFKRLVGDVRLQSIKCSGAGTAQEKITLTFDDSTSSIEQLDQLVSSKGNAVPENGAISISIPDLDADLRTYNCLAAQDVFITPQGTIQIKTKKAFTFMHLEHPNRLFLIAH